jgi:predicted Zn-ribbon and HTH transcriptional regulator
MAKYIEIERPNGIVTIVRSELETGGEEPLTEHEQIINELYSKVKNLNISGVSHRSWECNSCGFKDYTDAISEDEIHSGLLQCSNCGSDEFHLV